MTQPGAMVCMKGRFCSKIHVRKRANTECVTDCSLVVYLPGAYSMDAWQCMRPVYTYSNPYMIQTSILQSVMYKHKL